MKLSTSELKEELSKRHDELQDYLTQRLYEVFYWIIHEDFFEKEEEIHIFDLIVRIILRADKGPAENLASLMVLLTPEKCFDYLDERTLSESAAFVRDSLKRDWIYCILKSKKKRP